MVVGERLFPEVEDDLVLGLEEEADSVCGCGCDSEDEGAEEGEAYDVLWT